MLKIQTLSSNDEVISESTVTLAEFLADNEGWDEAQRAAQLALEGQEVLLGGGAAPVVKINHVAAEETV